MKLRNSILFCALLASAQTLIEPRITSETLPSGGGMQIKVGLTSPHPITTGGNDFNLDSFDSVDGVAMLSPGGDAYGVAVVQGQRFVANLVSPQSTLGTQLDYPYLMVAARIKSGLTLGTKLPINFGASTVFQGPNGAYSASVKNGTLTIGGSVSVTNIRPGGGLLPAGTTVRILGTGFTPQTRVDITDSSVTNIRYVSPTEIDFTMGAAKDITGTLFRIRNPADNSQVEYYSYLRGIAVGSSSRPLVNACHPLYTTQTITSAGLTLPAAPANGFIALALKNSNVNSADVQLTLLSSGGATLGQSSVSLPSAGQFLRTLAELFGAVPADATVKITASLPIQALGLRGDDSTGSVTAFLTGAPPVAATPQLTLSSTALSFDAIAGGTAPAAKNINLGSTGSALAYTTAVNANWLSVSPSSGQTPATLAINANPAGLAAGAYSGTITLTPPAGSTAQSISVTLNVTAAPVTPQLTLSPASLQFDAQAGGSVPAAKTVSLNSTAAALNFTATSNASWLTVSPSSGQTPATLSIAPNQAGLAAGTYSAVITITPPAGSSAQTIPVTFNVTNTPVVSQLSISPASLSFDIASGGAALAKTLSVSSTAAPLAFTASSNASWLSVNPSSAQTPATLTVTANPAGLPQGTYTGTITLTPPAGSAVQTISAVLNVTALPQLSASPTTLSFDAVIGGAPPASRSIALSSTGTALSFTASTSAAWLSLNPASGQTPATLSLNTNPAGLLPGQYSATVTIASPTAATINFPVTLNVSAAATPSALRITPSTLVFSFTTGGETPPQQVAQLDSGTQPVSFSIAKSAAWFTVVASASSTPASLAVNVNPGGLSPGTYTGTVTVTPSSGAAQILAVSLIVNSATPTPPAFTAVVNAASQTSATDLAPGQIITIYGSGLGPVTGQGPILPAPDRIDTFDGGTRVWFGSVPAPILYTSSGQINMIVPYEATGTTTIAVEFNGTRSSSREISIVPAAPAIFTQDSSGKGRSAILNQDYSLNTPQRPAARGSVIMIYATGGGQTSPASFTGQVAGPELRTLLAPVTVRIFGRKLEPLYAGTAPGLVTGLVQINVLLPADLPTGADLPIAITIGGFSSPAGTTLAIE